MKGQNLFMTLCPGQSFREKIHNEGVRLLIWFQFLRLANSQLQMSIATRLGDVLDFGQLLKPFATINLPQSPTFLGNYCKGVKIYHFWATIIDIWRFFSGHTANYPHFFFQIWLGVPLPILQLRSRKEIPARNLQRFPDRNVEGLRDGAAVRNGKVLGIHEILQVRLSYTLNK